jgi:hypothetical protein
MTSKTPAKVIRLAPHRTQRELADLRAARAALKKTRGLIRLAAARGRNDRPADLEPEEEGCRSPRDL